MPTIGLHHFVPGRLTVCINEGVRNARVGFERDRLPSLELNAHKALPLGKRSKPRGRGLIFAWGINVASGLDGVSKRRSSSSHGGETQQRGSNQLESLHDPDQA
jgi:hypothetical protein